MNRLKDHSEEATTQGIEVRVRSFFVREHSDVQSNRYFFSYHIQIRNTGERTIQLLNRHWLITDGNGRVEEVRGPGVVGQQPKLSPGDSFEYESFCPLQTPTGSMRGSYECQNLDSSTDSSIDSSSDGSVGDQSGDQTGSSNSATPKLFDVEIPQFFLVEPNSFH